MPSYTRQQVIDERKCGLKYFDRAVAKVGIQKILEETVRIAKEFPDTWGRGWRNVDWAFGNAWRDAIGYAGQASENLDEALTPEQIAWLGEQLGHDVTKYTPGWERRPKGGEIKHRPKAEGKLSSDVIKKLLQRSVHAALLDPTSSLHIAVNNTGGTLDAKRLTDEFGKRKVWYHASGWSRDAKKKVDGKNVRVFGSALFDALVMSDEDDLVILGVDIQIGPAWPKAEQPPLVKLVLV